jgi:hypothetical protein
MNCLGAVAAAVPTPSGRFRRFRGPGWRQFCRRNLSEKSDVSKVRKKSVRPSVRTLLCFFGNFLKINFIFGFVGNLFFV